MRARRMTLAAALVVAATAAVAAPAAADCGVDDEEDREPAAAGPPAPFRASGVGDPAWFLQGAERRFIVPAVVDGRPGVRALRGRNLETYRWLAPEGTEDAGLPALADLHSDGGDETLAWAEDGEIVVRDLDGAGPLGATERRFAVAGVDHRSTVATAGSAQSGFTVLATTPDRLVVVPTERPDATLRLEPGSRVVQGAGPGRWLLEPGSAERWRVRRWQPGAAPSAPTRLPRGDTLGAMDVRDTLVVAVHDRRRRTIRRVRLSRSGAARVRTIARGAAPDARAVEEPAGVRVVWRGAGERRTHVRARRLADDGDGATRTVVRLRHRALLEMAAADLQPGRPALVLSRRTQGVWRVDVLRPGHRPARLPGAWSAFTGFAAGERAVLRGIEIDECGETYPALMRIDAAGGVRIGL